MSSSTSTSTVLSLDDICSSMVIFLAIASRSAIIIIILITFILWTQQTNRSFNYLFFHFIWTIGPKLVVILNLLGINYSRTTHPWEITFYFQTWNGIWIVFYKELTLARVCFHSFGLLYILKNSVVSFTNDWNLLLCWLSLLLTISGTIVLIFLLVLAWLGLSLNCVGTSSLNLLVCEVKESFSITVVFLLVLYINVLVTIFFVCFSFVINHVDILI